MSGGMAVSSWEGRRFGGISQNSNSQYNQVVLLNISSLTPKLSLVAPQKFTLKAHKSPTIMNSQSYHPLRMHKSHTCTYTFMRINIESKKIYCMH